MELTGKNPFADGDRQVKFYENNCLRCRKHTKEYSTLDGIACNLERSYFLCAIGLPIPVRHAKVMERGVCKWKRPI